MTAGSLENRPVSVSAVRRWVRRRQAARLDRGSTLGSLYFAALLGAVLAGIFWPTVRAVIWPVHQSMSPWTAGGTALICVGVLHVGARRLGPLALSRPAASWLLTAPVRRRSLLLPALGISTGVAAGLGILVAESLVGQVVARPVSAGHLALAGLLGALVAMGAMLVAYAGQSGRRWADDAGYPLLGLGLAGLLIGSTASAHQLPVDGVLGTAAVAVAAGLALVVGAATGHTVRRLPATGNDRLLDASHTAGTLFDSAYGVEPSFVTELVERRYWTRRRLRSTTLGLRLPLLGRRLPVLTVQDLRLLQRKPRRLVWLAGLATVPVLVARHGPGWLLAAVVLLGCVSAAATTTATTRTDAGNPVLLRLLALSSRQVVTERLWVPAVLASLWSGAALLLLEALGDLPPGPWWALGLALGPVGAVTAIRRARLGFVNSGLLPLDTPFGTVATGPVLGAVGGVTGLLLGIPAAAALLAPTPLTWTTVAFQALVSGSGLYGYLRSTTSATETPLTS